MNEFSDYIIFADESGDHGLDGIDPSFPVFALVFCLIKKKDYVEKIVPAFQAFKLKYWGHDNIILHERDIRKSNGSFSFLLTDRALREKFYEDINKVIEEADFKIFASVIDKKALKEKYTDPWNPYEIALLFCMEKLLAKMRGENQGGKQIHIMFESRGKVEDRQLELEFRRICDNKGAWGYKRPDFSYMKFDPHFLPKAVNSSGLQIADLVARPIALRTLRPKQENRAQEIIWEKLVGWKVFP